MLKLKKGDTVLVTTGKDKGRQGKVEKVYVKEKTVLVPNVNVYKRHLKKRGEEKGGIITFARPINISKVALVCPYCGKPTRVGFHKTKQEKIRICRKCEKPI